MADVDKGTALRDEYRARFAGMDEYRLGVWRIICGEYLSRWITADAAVLDLGCGWGEFSNSVTAARRYAMDLNPDAEARLPASTRFLHQDCSQPWTLADGELDVVFTSNFLEHLPDKTGIERTLAEAWRCLKPGGRLICLGPNIKHVPGEYWDFWDHQIPLTEASLAEVMMLRGFHIEQRIERFLPYSMSTGRTPPLAFVRWYLRLPFAWRFFGKQFLVVGRKP